MAILIAITGVVGIHQMVFTNLIMTTHVNKTAHRPLMNLMAVKRHKSGDVVHSKGRYQKSIVVIVPIFNHIDALYVKPNMVALKYLDFKKNVDLDVDVRVYNSIVKTNAKTSMRLAIH